MSSFLPRWHQEAMREPEQGVTVFAIWYDHTEGLHFAPRNLAKPIQLFGHHSGTAGELTAREFLDLWYSRSDVELERMREAVGWFVPFIECIDLGVDFGLREVEVRRLSSTTSEALSAAQRRRTAE